MSQAKWKISVTVPKEWYTVYCSEEAATPPTVVDSDIS